MSRRDLIAAGAVGAFALASCSDSAGAETGRFEVKMSDAQWRARLGAARFRILRQAGTEPPYSSPLEGEHRRGSFACAGCGLPLFASATKFESHTGWPSFFRPLPNAVITRSDRSLGVRRTEVLCRRCGGHLGHVFKDGPKPTGLRYCMNGLALKFVPA